MHIYIQSSFRPYAWCLVSELNSLIISILSEDEVGDENKIKHPHGEHKRVYPREKVASLCILFRNFLYVLFHFWFVVVYSGT